MSKPRRKIRISKVFIMATLGSAFVCVLVGVVVAGLWFKRQCNIVYDEVNSSVVKSGMKIHAEYDEVEVEISRSNINSVINSVTSRMVYFSSASKMPQAEPVILRFGDELLMEIYPDEGYGVFVKHVTNARTKYYIIENTCNFNNLKRMISVEDWSYPNILINN